MFLDELRGMALASAVAVDATGVIRSQWTKAVSIHGLVIGRIGLLPLSHFSFLLFKGFKQCARQTQALREAVVHSRRAPGSIRASLSLYERLCVRV